ncbi:jg5498 [Pararge aegeria aegeria]|uniref:Jg5498 protein n=1 Tax=Pararge aegeria aegeria TaxID=348720 RepID=A0A8S4SLL6_9NEOP|nr:jg5498 [Pararge aegeria aegeria]
MNVNSTSPEDAPVSKRSVRGGCIAVDLVWSVGIEEVGNYTIQILLHFAESSKLSVTPAFIQHVSTICSYQNMRCVLSLTARAQSPSSTMNDGSHSFGEIFSAGVVDSTGPHRTVLIYE